MSTARFRYVVKQPVTIFEFRRGGVLSQNDRTLWIEVDDGDVQKRGAAILDRAGADDRIGTLIDLPQPWDRAGIRSAR
ncbi:hypothetical protein D3C72_1638290 [compost metagenome]